MTNEELLKFREKRDLNLGSLVSTPPAPLAPDKQEQMVELPLSGASVDTGNSIATRDHSNEDLTKYNLKIKTANVEFLKRYAHTKHCMLGRKYTMAEAIDDAIDALKRHLNYELKELPPWKKQKK